MRLHRLTASLRSSMAGDFAGKNPNGRRLRSVKLSQRALVELQLHRPSYRHAGEAVASSGADSTWETHVGGSDQPRRSWVNTMLVSSKRPAMLLNCEQLEPRRTLSVNAFLSGGKLIIIGSPQADRLAITQAGDQILVSGLDANTLVNRAPQASFHMSDLKRDVFVQLDGGDNVVRIGGEDESSHTDEADDHSGEGGLVLPGNLTIKTNSGHDAVRVSFVQIVGNLQISTGAGADTVDIGRGPTFASEDHTEHSTSIAAAEPHDDGGCEDEGGPPADVIIGGSLSVSTSGGDDGVKVAFTAIGGSLDISTGTDNDTVVTGRGPIRGVHGEDECGDSAAASGLAAAAVDAGEHGGKPADVRVAGDVSVSVGVGNDLFLLKNMHVGEDVRALAQGTTARLGTQNLQVEGDTSIASTAAYNLVAILRSQFSGGFDLKTGGVDLALIDRSSFASEVDISLRGDSDALCIRDSIFLDEVGIDGGPGIDAVFLADDNLFAEEVELPHIESGDVDTQALSATVSDIDVGFGLYLQGHPN